MIKISSSWSKISVIIRWCVYAVWEKKWIYKNEKENYVCVLFALNNGKKNNPTQYLTKATKRKKVNRNIDTWIL